MLTDAVVGHQPESLDEEIRTVWIRCHPIIFSSVHSTLKQAVSLTLDALKKSSKHSQNSYAVEVIDLRDSINVFEITGPKSSQVIHGALTPTIARPQRRVQEGETDGGGAQPANSDVCPSFGRHCLICKALVLSQVTW
jgi:hypothetical protein